MTWKPDAVRSSQSGEIDDLDEKLAPVGTDLLIIEDSGDAFAKKKVLLTNVPAGFVSPYAQYTSVAGAPSPDVFAVAPTSTILMVDTTNDAVTLNLPAGGTHTGTFQVIDVGDNAGTNNITLIPNGGDTIKGGASYTLVTDGALAYFAWNDATGDWILPTWENQVVAGIGNLTVVETGGTPYAVTTEDVILCTVAPGVVNLPAGADGQKVIVKDKTGTATLNNLTINANGAETIDGAANLVIDGDYAAVQLVFFDTEWSVV